MSITIQNYRSTVAGANPDSLLPGQIAFNLADGTIFVGYGGDVNYDLNGNPVAPAPPAGQGWKEYPLTDAVGNVNQLIAGTNVTLSPANGQGNVTISSSVPAATPSMAGGVFGQYSSANANFGVGPNVLTSTSGTNNTAVGINCLDGLTSGSNNTAVGVNAGGNLATANFNTCVGSGAGASHTGQQSTFIGALAGNTGANQSVCVGYNSGRFTTGLNNTFVGTSAGNNVSTGGSNICVGYNAGSLLGPGSNNTLIGGWAGTNNLQSNVVISDGQGNIRFQANTSGAISLGTGGVYGTAGQVFTSAGSGAAAGWVSPAAQNFTGTIPATGVPTTIYQTTISNNGLFSAWGYLTVNSGADVIKTYAVNFLNTYNSFTGMAGPGGSITAGLSYTNPVVPEPAPSITVQYSTGQGGGVVSLYATASNAPFSFSLTLFRTN